MERTNQGGSVLSFVIIGVILAGLLIGGVYVVNRQTARPPVSVEQKPQPPANDQTTPQVEPDVGQSQPEAGAVNDGTVQLPATGPQEVAGSFIVLGLLGGLAVGYIRSRRPQLSL